MFAQMASQTTTPSSSAGSQRAVTTASQRGRFYQPTSLGNVVLEATAIHLLIPEQV